jgi:ABC-type Fe3+ transport system substrate-binding protein
MKPTFKKVGLVSAVVFLLAQASAALAADDWQAGAGAEWQKVLDAARQEGTVVVAAESPLSRPISTAFERDTGISVEFIGGSVSDRAVRLQREAEANNRTIDVAISGGTELLTMYPFGYLAPIKPRLMLPSVTDPSKWKDGGPKWFENEGAYMLKLSNWVHGWPVINADKVDVSKINSFKDLLKPEYKGKIAAYDPRRGGPGQSAAAYLVHDFGIDFVKQLYLGQEVTYTTDGRQLVEWAVRGTYPIVLGAVQVHVERFRRAGMKQLVVPTMEDGVGLTGGFGVMKLMTDIPHPNAATVFVNWMASQRGQAIYGSTMLEAMTRTDIHVDAVPDYVRPRPGAEYLDQYSEDWYKTERPKIKKALIEALGGR